MSSKQFSIKSHEDIEKVKEQISAIQQGIMDIDNGKTLSIDKIKADWNIGGYAYI